ncbi:hypothetical protein NDU88_003474 [Pleurodeles waltl]|uniref:Uncharacterized protein n=1 Tax=Pleurodeles waltl TaxID=8319 RepID=A0AAV7W290_PLEWA|nr:hypothetical protein NDU88_003474 [Pleurodeles waltl]
MGRGSGYVYALHWGLRAGVCRVGVGFRQGLLVHMLLDVVPVMQCAEAGQPCYTCQFPLSGRWPQWVPSLSRPPTHGRPRFVDQARGDLRSGVCIYGFPLPEAASKPLCSAACGK